MTFNEYVAQKNLILIGMPSEPPLITKESYARDVKGNR